MGSISHVQQAQLKLPSQKKKFNSTGIATEAVLKGLRNVEGRSVRVNSPPQAITHPTNAFALSAHQPTGHDCSRKAYEAVGPD